MIDPDPAHSPGVARLPDALTGPVARLALRQQNLRALLPVLLHDVNGSLNGLALSSELLSRLLPAGQGAGEGAASAANLLQRTRNELGRLRQALKALERHVLPGMPGVTPPPRTALVASLQEVQSVLMPAVRRSQLEWRLASQVDADVCVALRPEEAFELLAAFAIIAIESAPPRSVLDLAARHDGPLAVLTLGHAGAARSTVAVELHRELLRVVTTLAGGSVEWQQSDGGSRARLGLPAVPAG